ncbi:MAG: ribosome biogenesis GTPase Der [Proteobacteria bacterium]|nr:ribosome biogenesis GTPase Der [Pseudomonadota bacterium]
MLPIITIVGRPNVGKSTLFNFLTQSRNALVADFPGVTRDRQYGRGVIGARVYWVVDTGGIVEMADSPDMVSQVQKQVQQAIDEADKIIFLLDAKSGLTAADSIIAQQLRPYQNKIVIAVNKVDRMDADIAVSDFYQLGFGAPQAISAKSGRGVENFISQILQTFPLPEEQTEQASGICIAVMGRPNVGKSTLINRILGEERVIVLDEPGTTRDSIYIPYERRGQRYTLIDTAGVRRKSKIEDTIEKFSVIKSLQALETAHVVVMVFDAREGVTDQDMRLLGLILESGRGLVLAFNKWDGMSEYEREQTKQAIDRRLQFVNFARRYMISALHGTGVGELYRAIDEAYASSTGDLSTPQLTQVLEQATFDHQPPLVGGRRIRLRYAHLGGHHPLVIVIHGKQIESLPDSYKRYLAHYFRQSFKLVGIPVRVQLINDKNPYIKD